MYLRGDLQDDIAQELNIDQSTVSRDLKALQAQWLQSALRDFDEMKVQEIAKIDNLERIYHVGWLRSQEDAETLRQEGSKGDSGKAAIDKIIKTAKGQAGDPRFLAGVERCIERRCKILGIDAPIKHKQENLNIDLAALSTKQLERLAAGESLTNVLATSSTSNT